MDTSQHNLHTLFEQLGLPADQESIETFISKYAPLPQEVALPDATFWTAAQSSFLHQGIEDDSDWAEVIDELDALLRH